ncbi:sensor domain-containing diguanylate cyclase [Pantoea sp. EA-12]|uniref:sensor domain-containing diguanylate cyclase n=1 Tax=Pantoea sp. EA-12 TaxID=3043303 RepID=UPI0024B56617|nr:sensor domain-containing diguanylate cyclase [Pantoea sp. EA-12]MDI9221607.1 sensor domain-containing diguanylate cyclase [Pantoea sp. EA-12]
MSLSSKTFPLNKPYSSLVRSVLLFCVLLVVAMAGSTAWTLHEDWHRTVQQTEDMAVNLSLSQARQAQDTMLQTELALREMQRDLQNSPLDGTNATALSQTMRTLQTRLPQLHGLFYYDAQGKWIATSARHVPAGINNSDREYFRYHRDSIRDSVHIGPVIRSRSTGDLVIPVSLRVSDASHGFSGILLATVSVDYFRRFYSYYELGKNDVLVLMLADSTVLYARPKPDSYIGKSLSGSHLFRQMLLNAERGSGEWAAALDGRRRIFGFASAERYPLVVAAGYDEHTLFRHWLKSHLQDVALSSALLISVLVLGLFIVRQARLSQRYQERLIGLQGELAAANHSLDRLAHTDSLTGLANRRLFDRFLHDALHAGEKDTFPVSLILIDVDYFKRYNDKYGHVMGDECLKKIATTLSSMTQRRTDRVARYGGEEFAIILAGADEAQAVSMARRATEAVARLNIPHVLTGVPGLKVTLSAGCATAQTRIRVTLH